MWNAIPYVTSGITLVAFIAAIAAWTYKSKLDERQRLIRTAPEGDRGPLVRNALEFLNVDTAELTKQQQYNIALEQIHARAQRFKITAALIGFLAFIAAGVTLYVTEFSGRRGSNDSEVKRADPNMVGFWAGAAYFNGREMQLRFHVGPNGEFSRRYFRDGAGTVDPAAGMLIDNNPREKLRFTLADSNSLILSDAELALRFDLKRVGSIEDAQQLIIGKWKGSLFFQGAWWETTLEVGMDRRYRSHTEAVDEGKISAANNKFDLISRWHPTPISGTYTLLSPTRLSINLYGFDDVTLQREK